MSQPKWTQISVSKDNLNYNPQLWDEKAEDWDKQVSIDGDVNRRYNSDPVLWKFLGNVEEKIVLDAGCGTGYLMRKLIQKGSKKVIGIDFSPKMIELAKQRLQSESPNLFSLGVDSCSELSTVSSESVDIIVSNYVLMDLPDLDGAVKSFFRVLKPGGKWVLVFSHPAFDFCSHQRESLEKPFDTITFRWTRSYFDEVTIQEAPWGHFKTNFVVFHRPLCRYFKAFKDAGFRVEDFDEPIMDKDVNDLSEDVVMRNRMRPGSVAFLLVKNQQNG